MSMLRDRMLLPKAYGIPIRPGLFGIVQRGWDVCLLIPHELSGKIGYEHGRRLFRRIIWKGAIGGAENCFKML